MLRTTRKHRKKLAKLVLAALLSTGGVYGLMGPSVAEAADSASLKVTGYASGSFTSDPPETKPMTKYDDYYYAPTNGNVTILELAQGTWSNSGDIYIAGHVGLDTNGANGFTVNMTGSDVVVSELAGGVAATSETVVGNASGNTVVISAGKVNDYVYGGYSYYGSANNNTVTISAVAGDAYVYGGEAEVDAKNNTVTISGEANVGYVVGGEAYYGSADNNTIEIKGDAAVEYGYVVGGESYYGASADNNTVTISENAKVGENYYAYVYGGYASSGGANNNTVTIKDNTIVGDSYYVYVYGGYGNGSEGESSNNNKVTISGDAVVGGSYTYYENVIGGYSDKGDAINNTVTISENAKVGSGAEYLDIHGGTAYAYDSESTVSADKNTVTISDSAEVGSGAYYVYIYGGGGTTADYYYYTYATANNNTVTISGKAEVGTNAEDYVYIYGGQSYYNSANGNTVTISDDAKVGTGADYVYVFGGQSYYGSTTNSADNNTVTISGKAEVGTNAEDYVYIYGGQSSNYASANGNTVTIKDDAKVGANVGYSVYIHGGESYYGSADNNTVTISDNATVGADVGYYVEIYGGESYAASANNNTVTISGGTVGNADSENGEYSVIVGGASYVEASGNTVEIKGDAKVYAGAVVGGYSEYAYDYGALVNTNNNTVTISAEGAEVGLVYGGRTGMGAASENTVTISAGSVTGKVGSPSYYYGIAAVAGGYTVSEGDAVSNTVEINGATISNSNENITMAVVGGYAGGGNATGNTVKLHDATISGGGIYGGATSDSGTGDVVTGNTLVISGSSTVDAEVTNFETIKLDKTLEWNPDKPVLKANQFTDNADGTRAALDVTDVKADIAPGAGGQMTLLASETENDFATLDLTYSGGSGTLDESMQSQVVKDEEISEERKGVAVISQSVHKVSLDEENSYKNVLYSVKNETKGISLKEIKWQKDAELFDGSSYDYEKVTKIDTAAFDVTYEDGVPQTVAKGDSMTLLKANDTLKAIVNEEKSKAYSFTPVSGVTVDAAVTGKLANSGNNVVFTATENKAGKLTFGDVEWKTSGALLKRPSNIIFAGADVDTAKINFVNVTYLDANQKMTLVSDFGDSVGTITGSKYMAGTAFEGEGKASLKGGDLIFTTTTEAGLSEQTHKTVMAMDAGLAMLKTGSEFVGKTIDGLADIENKGKDGVSTFASVGGGTSRYSTGSHVNTHAWNAVVGVGKTNETKKGTIEYGVFGEYGKGSYTLHSDAGNGDGDAHYAGGGLLAKFTNKHNVYAEASVRAGRLSDSSSDIMRDGLGNAYGYDVHANYYGAHIGAGKIINYKGGKSLDVYGKFFYLKRDGVEYDAVQHYNLDSVSSSILRLGARYGTTDKKWNWYGGLAYEYEFDGEATGTVNGKEIRAASIKGSSVRGEFGMRMDATKDNPWQTDISIYGYGGKHRGFGGNVSVTYKF